MKFNKLIAAMSAVTMLGSLAVAVPASAEEVYAGEVALTKDDVTLSYYYGKISERTITVGTKTGVEITSGGDYNKLANLMDGVANSDEASKEAYIGANGENNRYIIVDLGEDHKAITKIEATNMSAAAVIGLTNTIATAADDTITLAYAVRANGSNIKNPDNLAISVSSETSSLNSGKNDATLTGSAIGGYRYVILHSNNGGSRLAELTLSYESDVPATAVASTVVDGATHYYTTLPEAVTAAADGGTVTLLADAALGNSRLTISKNLTITADTEKTITGNAAPGGILVNNGKSVTFDKINITASGENNAIAVAQNNSKLTIKNAAVTGDVYQENGTGTEINLDNVAVSGTVKTRYGFNKASNSACAVTLTNGTTADAVLYGSSVDTYTATGSTVTTVTDVDYVAPPTTTDEYFTFTGEDGVSYDTVEVTASNGDREETQSASIATISGTGSLFVAITGVPEGITIKTVTLK